MLFLYYDPGYIIHGGAVAYCHSLEQVWQRKLSSLAVAHFPWDPPVSTAPAVHPPAVQSNGQSTRAQQQQQQAASGPAASTNADGPRIKVEPGYEDVAPGSPIPNVTVKTERPSPVLTDSTSAAQRAASLLQQKFGNQAKESIGAIQSGIAQQEAMAAQRNTTSNQSQSQSDQPTQGEKVGPAQTDGAGDAAAQWSTILSLRQAAEKDGHHERARADRIIRRYVEERALEMEGGGLLRPLSEHAPIPKRRKRVAKKLDEAARSSAQANPPPKSKLAQHDGPDDSDYDSRSGIKDEGDFDEDAINSDLDDPEDSLHDGEEDDDAMSQIMLCMYDRVQRTKNKWKCVLKDGVLTVGGKE